MITQKNTFMWAILVTNLLFNMPILLKADWLDEMERAQKYEKLENELKKAENEKNQEYQELHDTIEALKNDAKAFKDKELELIISAQLEKASCNLECTFKAQDNTMCQHTCEIEYLKKIVSFWKDKVNNSNK